MDPQDYVLNTPEQAGYEQQKKRQRIEKSNNGLQKISKPRGNPTGGPDYETSTGPKITRLYGETMQLHTCKSTRW